MYSCALNSMKPAVTVWNLLHSFSHAKKECVILELCNMAQLLVLSLKVTVTTGISVSIVCVPTESLRKAPQLPIMSVIGGQYRFATTTNVHIPSDIATLLPV